jgi:hypothetical protein
VVLTTHLLLAPRSGKSRAIPLLPLWAFGSVTGYLYLYLYRICSTFENRTTTFEQSLLQQGKTVQTKLSVHDIYSEEKAAVIWDVMLCSLVDGCVYQLSF